jgi:SagB-type dehydrogenase family enzyme
MKIKLNPAHFKEEGLQSLLEKRYSCRDFQNKALKLDDIATILWAACGRRQDAVTGATRTIPSAGATNPLELYLVVGKGAVSNLGEGIYHYLIDEHSLQLCASLDKRSELAKACFNQDFIKEAPVSIVIAADSNRTASRYAERAVRYVHTEAGHACQNVYLAVACLGLGTVEVGAFDDQQVAQVAGLDKNYSPLIVMPVGYARLWEK